MWRINRDNFCKIPIRFQEEIWFFKSKSLFIFYIKSRETLSFFWVMTLALNCLVITLQLILKGHPQRFVWWRVGHFFRAWYVKQHAIDHVKAKVEYSEWSGVKSYSVVGFIVNVLRLNLVFSTWITYCKYNDWCGNDYVNLFLSYLWCY